jgi:hypothetical protein
VCFFINLRVYLAVCWLISTENKYKEISIKQDGKCMYYVKLFSLKSNKYYIFWVCVSVTIVIHHAMRMRRMILSSVVCPVLPYFSTLSRKRHDFRENFRGTENVFRYSLQHFSETFAVLKRSGRDIIYPLRPSCEVPGILFRFQWQLNFLSRI